MIRWLLVAAGQTGKSPVDREMVLRGLWLLAIVAAQTREYCSRIMIAI